MKTLSYYPIAATQYLAVFVTRMYLKISGYSVEKQESAVVLDKNSPRIIAANHHNMLDPFAALSMLPFRHIRALLPMKFMTANIHYYRAYRPLVYLLGCFPSHKQHHMHDRYGLHETKRSINNGFSVLIFPEGKRVKPGERVPAKHGIITLIQDLPSDPQLMTARISWSGKALSLRYRMCSERTDQDKLMDFIYSDAIE